MSVTPSVTPRVTQGVKMEVQPKVLKEKVVTILACPMLKHPEEQKELRKEEDGEGEHQKQALHRLQRKKKLP